MDDKKEVLTHKKLCKEIAKEVGRSDEKVAERYLEAIVKVIAAEVYMTGSCRIKNFGLFKIKQIGGKYMNTPIPTGGHHKIWIEPRNSITFIAADNLKYMITDDFIDLEEVRRQKRNEMRKARAEKKRLEKEREQAEKAERILKEKFKEQPKKNE